MTWYLEAKGERRGPKEAIRFQSFFIEKKKLGKREQ